MNRFRQFLKRNLDVIAFGAALSSVGPLMAWWSILVRRNIVGSDALLRTSIADNFEGTERLTRIAALDAATHKQLFMISGESAMAGLVLACSRWCSSWWSRSVSVRPSGCTRCSR